MLKREYYQWRNRTASLKDPPNHLSISSKGSRKHEYLRIVIYFKIQYRPSSTWWPEIRDFSRLKKGKEVFLLGYFKYPLKLLQTIFFLSFKSWFGKKGKRPLQGKLNSRERSRISWHLGESHGLGVSTAPPICKREDPQSAPPGCRVTRT